MKNPLLALLTAGFATAPTLCPDLPEEATGLPAVGTAPCEGPACQSCVTVCPTEAIQVSEDDEGGVVALDRGRCISCGECMRACPSGTLFPDRSTRTAVLGREALVLTNRPGDCGLRIADRGLAGLPQAGTLRPSASGAFVPNPQTVHPLRPGVRPRASRPRPRNPQSEAFRRSLHIREVSTGCSATDQEVAASTNPVFDVGRFGVHFVASPRFADALLVTGPVGRAMQEPLRRCYDAMAEPRAVIAVGTCAISGGLFRDSYAEAQGVDPILPADVYVPGCPPHPWSIIHGILLAMGRRI